MTLDYYNKNAEQYSQETLNIEFDSQRSMLLKYLSPNSYILDLGCGSGRDSKEFIKHGHRVTAVDGSSKMCEIASKHIGQEVINIEFQDLNENNIYDAVWASASLLHIRFKQLPTMLSRIGKALKPGGYLYASFKYGDFEGEKDGRYFTYITEKKLDFLLEQNKGLTLIDSKITKDMKTKDNNEKWLNIILRKQH